MSVWPGDRIGRHEAQRLLAYQGKEDCQDPRCRRLDGRCIGWHCARCDEPTSPQGHYDCERDA